MIYTTYLSNLKNLPEDSIKFLITRWKPRNTIDVKKYNLEWRPNLAPTELTLAKYKDKTIDWSEYRQRFIDESFENKLFMDGLQEVIDYNDQGLDVFLICYEKDDKVCHRCILQEIFEYNGYKCKEYRKE